MFEKASYWKVLWESPFLLGISRNFPRSFFPSSSFLFRLNPARQPSNSSNRSCKVPTACFMRQQALAALSPYTYICICTRVQVYVYLDIFACRTHIWLCVCVVRVCRVSKYVCMLGKMCTRRYQCTLMYVYVSVCVCVCM